MSGPRPLYAAIGGTTESAREQIEAIGPDSPFGPAPNVGDVPTWNGSAWVPMPGPGVAPGANVGVIFRPGGTPATGVVTTEADLQTAVAGFPGPVIVRFDDSYTSPIHLTMPWGVMYSMTWLGKSSGTPTSLVLDDGFQLAGPGGRVGITAIDDELLVSAQGLLGPIPFSLFATSDLLRIGRGSALLSGGVSAAFSIANTRTLFLQTQGQIGDGTNPVFSFGNGSGLTCFVEAYGDIRDNCLTGGNPASTAGFSVVSSALGGLSLVDPGFLGTISTTLLGESVYEAYDDLLVTPLLGANNVQSAIDALKALLIPGGGSSSIWRGTGAPTAPGIFNTWADLFAWIQAAPGSKTVYLDSTFGPLSVDPGLWVFNPPVQFVGSPTDPRTNLTLNESSFRNVFRWSRIKFLVLNTVGPPFGGFSETMEFDDCDVDMSSGGQPFIRTLTATLDVTFRDMAVYPTTQLMFDMQPGAPACTVRLYDGTSVALNSFSTAIGTTLTLIQDSSSTYLDQFYVFGTLLRQVENPAYIPGNPADWTPAPPTTVFEALDRLAAKFVASALGTP